MVTPLNVLIADDVPLMREVLGRFVTQLGNDKIFLARDGQEALAMCCDANNAMHVSFLDLNMPGFNGLELARLIQVAQPGCMNVLMTAQSDQATVHKAISVGVAGFIVKPFALSQIEQVLLRRRKLGGLA